MSCKSYKLVAIINESRSMKVEHATQHTEQDAQVVLHAARHVQMLTTSSKVATAALAIASAGNRSLTGPLYMGAPNGADEGARPLPSNQHDIVNPREDQVKAYEDQTFIKDPVKHI